MALIGMRNVCWGFGEPPLLENVTFQISKGERVSLVGRNGVGKSTLLKLLGGEMLPDSGDIWRQQGISVAALEQDVPAGFDGTIFDVVAQGLGETGRALAEHNQICRYTETKGNSHLVKRRDELQQILNVGEGWELLTDSERRRGMGIVDPRRKHSFTNPAGS